MKYFQNLYALLLGAFYTRVKGGRIKRFIIFLVSLLVIVGSIWLMYRWSFIHKSKHIIYLSHPVAVDTARNHYMKVDLCIRSAEGYTMKKDKEEDHYVYAHSISTTQQHRIKDPGTSLPSSHDIRCLNYYFNDSIITYRDTLSSKEIPKSDIGNLVVFGHYYNCDFSEVIHGAQIHKLVQGKYEEELKEIDGTLHALVFDNDPLCLKLPLGAKLQKKLSDGKVSFPGDFNVDWNYIISPNNDEVYVLDRKSSSRKVNTRLSDFLKLHDISKHYYEFYVFTQSIDEMNLTFQTNEMVEISQPFADAKISENSISVRIIGDHYSEGAGISGCQSITFHTKNLESENAQFVRIFILTTFCAFALGFFLRTLSEYIWIIIRKIQKTKSQ